MRKPISYIAPCTKPRKTERKRKSNSILVITVKTVSDRYNAHRWYPKTRNTQITRLSFPTHCYTEKNACAGDFCTKIVNQIPIMYQCTNLERASLPSVPTDAQGRRSGRVPRLHPSSSRRVLKSSSSTLLSRLRSLIEPPCGLHGRPVE
jgi:hypothetical protein